MSDKNFPTEKILGFVNEITINLQKWPRPGQLVGKTKTNVKQILRWNKLETKQNMQQTAQRGHSNTVGNPACRGWHLKMVKWHVLTMWRLSKNVDPDYSMPIIVMTHRSFSVFYHHILGNLSQVQVNLHWSWLTDQCNWHRLIDWDRKKTTINWKIETNF